MGIVVPFKGNNKVLTAPAGDDRVSAIPVFNNGHVTVTAWQFTPEELESINRTGCVFLGVVAGSSSPPVFVGSEDSVRDLVQDYGGSWKGRL